MPIYEFYCAECHTVFSFLIRGELETGQPKCPQCAAKGLERRPSSFAIGPGSGRDEDADLGDLGEEQLGAAMSQLADDIGQLERSADTTELGQALRRFTDATGLEMGGELEEALGRMDQGGDIEEIEAELDRDNIADTLFRRPKSGQKAPAKVHPGLHYVD
ncbi:MAG: zinc ribbon domain-containing protein [Acidobacteriota bacterium]